MDCSSISSGQHINDVPLSVWGYAEAVKEEKGLIVKFGDDYKRYMEKVSRMNLVLGIIRLLRRKPQSNR